MSEQVLRAKRLLDGGDFAAALAVLRAAEDICRDNGRAWELRGLAYFAAGDIPQATAAFEQATALVRLGLRAQCRLAECYLRARRREVAAVIFAHLATFELTAEAEVQRVAVGLLRTGVCEVCLEYCQANLHRFSGNHVLFFTASQAMRRLGKTIRRSTLCGWQAALAELATPLVERMKFLVLQSQVIHTD
ncbi:MAG: hypothetical protein DWQ31_11235, partial [Planctomycetota bacterium]